MIPQRRYNHHLLKGSCGTFEADHADSYIRTAAFSAQCLLAVSFLFLVEGTPVRGKKEHQ